MNHFYYNNIFTLSNKKIHLIISDISNPVNLQQYIDNRDGFKRVGLKSLTYCLGWHNIHNEVLQKDDEFLVRIPSGYYSFQQLADIFRRHKINMSVNETNGRVTLTTPSELKTSKRLKTMLGLQIKGRFFPKQTYQGDRPLDFAVIKSLLVHLSEINSSYNYFNGSPFDVLTVIPIENKNFGDIVTVRFEHSELKPLKTGALSELKLYSVHLKTQQFWVFIFV